MLTNPSKSELAGAFSQEALSVFSVTGESFAAGTGRSRPVVHTQLVFPVSGSLAVLNDGCTLAAGVGEILHLSPDAGTSITAVGEDPCDCVVITYIWGHTAAHVAPTPFASTWKHPLPGGDETLARVKDLEALGSKADLESRLNQIIGATTFVNTLFTETGDGAAPEGVRRAKAHMDAHYADQITLEELGSIAGLSPKRFSEKFAETFGIRPMPYLIGTRIEHANELLGTDMLVKDIARMVGYEDQFYFSRIYKKYTGLSPETARKSMQAEGQDT